MKIANDPEHILREQAVEALGHLGRSQKAEEILGLLTELARGEGPLAGGALRGLRWFDHPEGWQLIRKRATVAGSRLQPIAIELLGYHDEPATRELLLRLVAQLEDGRLLQAALASARRLCCADSPEPYYAALQNDQADEEDVIDHLRERGDARRLLEILPRLGPWKAELLKELLLARQPLPVAEAQAVIAGPDPMAAGVAAHLLGRAGLQVPTSGPAVTKALRRWWAEWDKLRLEEGRRAVPTGQGSGRLLQPLLELTWAAGRLGVATDTLLSIVAARPDVASDRPLRRTAVAGLAEGSLTKPVAAALQGLLTDNDPDLRTLAAEALSRGQSSQAAEAAGRVLSDRVAFNRMAARAPDPLTSILRGSAAQVHYQGVALPHLADRADVTGLVAVAGNPGFAEDVRLGAIEGLAAAAQEAAEAELVRIGRSEGEPEELRKAAWRGLRRSRRARKKRQTGKP